MCLWQCVSPSKGIECRGIQKEKHGNLRPEIDSSTTSQTSFESYIILTQAHCTSMGPTWKSMEIWCSLISLRAAMAMRMSSRSLICRFSFLPASSTKTKICSISERYFLLQWRPYCMIQLLVSAVRDIFRSAGGQMDTRVGFKYSLPLSACFLVLSWMLCYAAGP